MDGLLIKELTEEYLEETIKVAIRAFGSETVRDNAEIDFPLSLRDNLRLHKTLIALVDGKIAGAVQCVHSNLSVNIYNICWVCVDPKHQRKGIGRQIVEGASEYIEKEFLKGKPGTIALAADIDTSYYEKSGFSTNNNTHSGGKLMTKIVGEN